jgi:hypothetical protein
MKIQKNEAISALLHALFHKPHRIRYPIAAFLASMSAQFFNA